jgi:hypothetical protein
LTPILGRKKVIAYLFGVVQWITGNRNVPNVRRGDDAKEGMCTVEMMLCMTKNMQGFKLSWAFQIHHSIVFLCGIH